MENAGWKNMHSLLDQHMPQKKKRFALLYFTYFIFGALMLISFLSWLNYKNPGKQINNSKEIPIAIVNSKQEIESNEKMTIPVPDISNKTTGNQKLIPEINHKQTVYNSKSTKNKPEENNKPKAENNYPDLISIKSIAINNQSADEKVTEQNEITSTINKNLIREPMDIPLLPGLAFSSIQCKPFNHSIENLLLPEIIKPVISKSSTKVQFGIQSGIQYFTSNKTISYFAGIQADYKLSEKWSLSLSPSLEINKGNFLVLDDEEQSLILNSLDSFRLNTDIFDTKKENVVSFPASGLNSSTINKYSTLYNLQLPVSINYHLNKYWQASVGLKLSIPLQQDILTSIKSNIIQWDDPKTSTWHVEPINYFVQTGIQYHPWNSFGISLVYSFLILKQNSSQNNFSTSGNPTVNAITENNLRHFKVSLNYRF